MSNPIRWTPPRAARAAIALLLVAGATVATATAATIVHFEHESYPQFQGQLGHREVHAVVLHAKQHIAHISLADGRHMTAVYPAGEQARIVQEAQAKGASATVAVSTKAAPVHHKLRYIAGGVLIVVILVVLVVLLVGRRRELAEDEEPPTENTPAASPPTASG